MGSKQIQVVDFPASFLLKLWLLALAGFFLPPFVADHWPDRSWAGTAAKAHQLSIERGQWYEPWFPVNKKVFSSAWVQCASLEDALALDRKVDDGNLHKGNLILTKGGMAWLPK